MIELGLNAGLRVNEMASLKHRNVFINGESSSISVVGKGDKKRIVWISTAFKRTFQMYINYKKRFGYDISDEAYVLNNLKGTRITKRALQKFFKQIILKAGLPSRYYIHCLRHTYSTFLLKASKKDYKLVKEQMGHSSITTTQVYANVFEDEYKKAAEKLYQ